jgi:NADH dehydrogenase [ubiquinone] 1 alpha subcomplex assembly factor 1
MKFLLMPGCLIFSLSSMIPVSAENEPAMKMISTFDGDKNEPKWFSVNDSVMGGTSQGKPLINDGLLVFSGKLSLENNGGFSSLRTSGRKYDFTGKSGFVLRVKGDGRTYKMRIETDARFNGSEIGYQVDFKTEEGKFIEVNVPFDSFKPGWRGRKLDGPALDLSKIEEIGLVLADGKAGAFKVELDWLAVE